MTSSPTARRAVPAEHRDPRGALPALFNALTAEITLEAVAKTVTFEVAQHLGDNMVRCISM